MCGPSSVSPSSSGSSSSSGVQGTHTVKRAYVDQPTTYEETHLKRVRRNSSDMRSPSDVALFQYKSVEDLLNDWVSSSNSTSETENREIIANAIKKSGATLSDNGCLVIETLNLRDSPGLTSFTLPAGSQLKELDLKGCIGLRAFTLPGNSQLKKLDLSGCTGLRAFTLPAGSQLKILYAFGCTELTSFTLPADSQLESLHLDYCTGLTSFKLPDNSQLKSLHLNGCKGLTDLTLPADSQLESLHLDYCTGLKDLTLPAGSQLKKLYSFGCTGLRAFKLPADSQLKLLDLSGCTELISCTLPADSQLEILDLRYCTELASFTLPADSQLEILSLRGCTKLTSFKLPADSQLDILSLRGCTGLRAFTLPEDSQLLSLYLDGCTGLTSFALPADSELQMLSLEGCTSLRGFTLPEYSELTELYLDGCTSLTGLPDTIVNLGSAEQPARIDLRNTGISEAVRYRLQQLMHEMHAYYVRFEFNNTVLTYSEYSSLDAAIDSWTNSADQNPDIQRVSSDQLPLRDDEKVSLRRYLSRLHQAQDAKNAHTKPVLMARVQRLLQSLQTGAESFREEAMSIIHYANTSCDDGTIKHLGQIELMILVEKAKSSDHKEEALKSLAMGLLALEEVHKYAAQVCERPGFVDQVEVYLMLEIRVKALLERDEIHLPVETSSMYFENCAMLLLREDDFELAAQAAINAVKDPQQVESFLSKWDPWQTFQRSNSAKSVDWQQLPDSNKSFENTDKCPISLKLLPDIKYPVELRGNLYELQDLLEAFVRLGKDPASNTEFELKEISRVVKSS